jgi:hypothetical protein
MGLDIRFLSDGASQLHGDPAVALGGEVNMVSLQHTGLPHHRLYGPKCVNYPDAASRQLPLDRGDVCLRGAHAAACP